MGPKAREGYLCNDSRGECKFTGVNESKGNVVAESILSLKLRYKMQVLYREQRRMTNTCIYWVYGWAEAARRVTSNSHGTRVVHGL